MTFAMPEVPQGCSLTLVPMARVEAGTTPEQTQDEVVFTAECACGKWESEELCSPVLGAENVGRTVWLTEHLNAEHDGEPGAEDQDPAQP